MDGDYPRVACNSSFVTCTSDYSPDFILLAFYISCGGGFRLSRFTNLILRLCYLDLGLLCRPHHSCLYQYLMRGRDYLSRTAHLIIWLCYLDLGAFCSPHRIYPQYLMRGKFLPTTACGFDSYLYRLVILFRPNSLRLLILPRPGSLFQLVSTFSSLSVSCGRKLISIEIYPFNLADLMRGKLLLNIMHLVLHLSSCGEYLKRREI